MRGVNIMGIPINTQLKLYTLTLSLEGYYLVSGVVLSDKNYFNILHINKSGAYTLLKISANKLFEFLMVNKLNNFKIQYKDNQVTIDSCGYNIHKFPLYTSLKDGESSKVGGDIVSDVLLLVMQRIQLPLNTDSHIHILINKNPSMLDESYHTYLCVNTYTLKCVNYTREDLFRHLIYNDIDIVDVANGTLSKSFQHLVSMLKPTTTDLMDLMQRKPWSQLFLLLFKEYSFFKGSSYLDVPGLKAQSYVRRSISKFSDKDSRELIITKYKLQRHCKLLHSGFFNRYKLIDDRYYLKIRVNSQLDKSILLNLIDVPYSSMSDAYKHHYFYTYNYVILHSGNFYNSTYMNEKVILMISDIPRLSLLLDSIVCRLHKDNFIRHSDKLGDNVIDGILELLYSYSFNHHSEIPKNMGITEAQSKLDSFGTIPKNLVFLGYWLDTYYMDKMYNITNTQYKYKMLCTIHLRLCYNEPKFHVTILSDKINLVGLSVNNLIVRQVLQDLKTQFNDTPFKPSKGALFLTELRSLYLNIDNYERATWNPILPNTNDSKTPKDIDLVRSYAKVAFIEKIDTKFLMASSQDSLDIGNPHGGIQYKILTEQYSLVSNHKKYTLYGEDTLSKKKIVLGKWDLYNNNDAIYILNRVQAPKNLVIYAISKGSGFNVGVKQLYSDDIYMHIIITSMHESKTGQSTIRARLLLLCGDNTPYKGKAFYLPINLIDYTEHKDSTLTLSISQLNILALDLNVLSKNVIDSNADIFPPQLVQNKTLYISKGILLSTPYYSDDKIMSGYVYDILAEDNESIQSFNDRIYSYFLPCLIDQDTNLEVTKTVEGYGYSLDSLLLKNSNILSYTLHLYLTNADACKRTDIVHGLMFYKVNSKK